MNTLLQDIRFGLRMLLKSPSISIVATIALALGIGANTAIFSVVNAVLLRPLPFPDPDSLVQVFETNQQRGLMRGSHSYPNFFDLRAQSTVFTQIASYYSSNFIMTGRGEPVRLEGAVMTADMFPLLGVAPLHGRTFVADEDKPSETGRVAVLSCVCFIDCLRECRQPAARASHQPTGTEPRSLISAATKDVAAMDPDLPLFDVKTMEEYMSASVAGPRFNTTLLSIFAGVALVLTIVGLYGVMSYSVAQRTNEIGIRLALGAQGRDVLLMIVRQGSKLILIGLAAGLAGAYAVTRLVESLLFGVKTKDPFTFAAVAILLGVVALLACYVPAWRATKVDPMEALRYE